MLRFKSSLKFSWFTDYLIALILLSRRRQVLHLFFSFVFNLIQLPIYPFYIDDRILNSRHPPLCLPTCDMLILRTYQAAFRQFVPLDTRQRVRSSNIKRTARQPESLVAKQEAWPPNLKWTTPIPESLRAKQ